MDCAGNNNTINTNLCMLNEIEESDIVDNDLLRFPVCYDGNSGFITFETLTNILGISTKIQGLVFSQILPNPIGGDTGDTETFTLTNTSTVDIDLSQFVFGRALISGLEDIQTLSGLLGAGNSLTIPCNPGGAAILNNVLGGVVYISFNGDICDLIAYPPTPVEGTQYNYSLIPNTTTQRNPI